MCEYTAWHVVKAHVPVGFVNVTGVTEPPPHPLTLPLLENEYRLGEHFCR